jgi:hypothetical protein
MEDLQSTMVNMISIFDSSSSIIIITKSHMTKSQSSSPLLWIEKAAVALAVAATSGRAATLIVDCYWVLTETSERVASCAASWATEAAAAAAVDVGFSWVEVGRTVAVVLLASSRGGRAAAVIVAAAGDGRAAAVVL